jgi:NAD(P)-dependent dehydrogenase (short-subunit alcohol dehydrogenase family)
MKTLEGKIAVVAGATRGAGRGIATALGEQGATVYCTGRSVRGATTGRPETIEETAELVTARGGRGIAMQVDHTDPAQVATFFAGLERVDILVNDIWGGDAVIQWGKKFWEVDLDAHLALLDRAIKTHIITSHHAVPLMREGGLIVEITDGDGYYYRGNFFYDIIKTTVIRLAFAQAQELAKKRIDAIAVTPGFLRSESMLEHFGVTEANWRDAAEKDPPFIASETPLFVGRCVAALAVDSNRAAKNGRVFASWDLAEEYGVNDADGSRPHFIRWMAANMPEYVWKRCDDGFYAYCDSKVTELIEKQTTQ